MHLLPNLVCVQLFYSYVTTPKEAPITNFSMIRDTRIKCHGWYTHSSMVRNQRGSRRRTISQSCLCLSGREKMVRCLPLAFEARNRPPKDLFTSANNKREWGRFNISVRNIMIGSLEKVLRTSCDIQRKVETC